MNEAQHMEVLARLGALELAVIALAGTAGCAGITAKALERGDDKERGPDPEFDALIDKAVQRIIDSLKRIEAARHA